MTQTLRRTSMSEQLYSDAEAMQWRQLLLFHQLDNIFVLQHVILAHFLRIVFHGRSPHECAGTGRVVGLDLRAQDELNHSVIHADGIILSLLLQHQLCRAQWQAAGVLVTCATVQPIHSPGGGEGLLSGINISTDWWSSIWRRWCNTHITPDLRRWLWLKWPCCLNHLRTACHSAVRWPYQCLKSFTGVWDKESGNTSSVTVSISNILSIWTFWTCENVCWAYVKLEM